MAATLSCGGFLLSHRSCAARYTGTSRDQTDGSGSYQQGEASTYDAGNELTQIKHYTGPPKTLSSTENFVAGTDFDNNGNQLVTTAGKSYKLAYYKNNRLHTLTGTGYSDTCSYCVDGRLAARGTMSFEYDGHQRQQDQDSSQPVTWVPTVNEYFGGDLMVHYTYVSGGTSPASITLTWMLMDPSGNMGVMTDTSGTVLATCTADLCGTSPQQNGTATTSEYQWGCTYGYSYRSTPKVYQIGERIYDPGQGRWMQQDPLSEGQGDWSYCANSSANAVDPSGLIPNPKYYAMAVASILAAQGGQSNANSSGASSNSGSGPSPILNALRNDRVQLGTETAADTFGEAAEAAEGTGAWSTLGWVAGAAGETLPILGGYANYVDVRDRLMRAVEPLYNSNVAPAMGGVNAAEVNTDRNSLNSIFPGLNR